MFKRGGIYSVRLPHGDLQEEPEICPCLVVSNNISNQYSPVVTIIPLNFTRLDKIYDFETFLPASPDGLLREAKVSSHLLITIDKENVVGERLGFLPKSLMSQVDKALCFQLGIEQVPGTVKGEEYAAGVE
jgi:mRNA interferase MazF